MALGASLNLVWATTVAFLGGPGGPWGVLEESSAGLKAMNLIARGAPGGLASDRVWERHGGSVEVRGRTLRVSMAFSQGPRHPLGFSRGSQEAMEQASQAEQIEELIQMKYNSLG